MGQGTVYYLGVSWIRRCRNTEKTSNNFDSWVLKKQRTPFVSVNHLSNSIFTFILSSRYDPLNIGA